MRLYFIGGASGSGKTAVMPYLKQLLGDGIAVYDFDDIGVPEGADKKWRGESTEKWLQKLLSEGKDACLLGQIVLGEILSCPSAKYIDKINFCLLDVSDFERIGRLKKRNTYSADQNMLNWSSWLRMHTRDPEWTSHVIQEDAADIMDFTRLSALKSYEEVANVKILDTTDYGLHEVAGELADWLRSFDIAPFHVVKVQPHEVFISRNNKDKTMILSELQSREPIFHHPEKFGITKEDIENQICDEFWEVGASGNVYTKQDVIETLLERYNNPDYQDIWGVKDFELTKIATDNYLTSYILIQDKTRVTRRSTLWRRVNGDWKILYHQGTLIEG